MSSRSFAYCVCCALGLLAAAYSQMGFASAALRPVGPPAPPDVVYPVGENDIWMATWQHGNHIAAAETGSNQVITAVVGAPQLTAKQYAPCGNRWRFETNDSSAVLITDQSEAHSSVFNIAWNPHLPQQDQFIWLWDGLAAGYTWSIKLVTGYYKPTGDTAKDGELVKECKRRASDAAAENAQSPLGSDRSDDDNPRPW
jgi:hypothetical protein